MVKMLIVTVLLLALVGNLYVMIRTIAVCRFVSKLIDMAYYYEIRNIHKKHQDAFEWFCEKHSYESMIRSFKPLKLKY